MSGETEADVSGWTIDTLRVLQEAIRDGDLAVAAERDRRYAEVNIEKEKALKIKETADLAALQLAREIQTYKDEKANELREQINSERGRYLTREEYTAAHNALTDKIDTQLKPIAEYVTRQQGRTSGIGTSAAVLYSSILIVIALIAYFLPHH